MILYLLIFPVAILVGNAIDLILDAGSLTPRHRVGMVPRLVGAFGAWGTVLTVQVILDAVGMEKGSALDRFAHAWWPMYVAAAGAFLGMGFRWWSRAWWRKPFDFAGGFEFRLAARISFRAQRSISSLVVRLGILSIMAGVAVMEVAVAIVYGFEHAIQEKVIGFGAHIRIGNLLEELESEVNPLPRYNDFVPEIATLPGVKNVSPYIMQTGLLRTEAAQEGVSVKGVDSTYDWTFFKSALVEGRIPDVTLGRRYSRELLVSRKLADLVDARLGDKAFLYFFDAAEGKARAREFDIVGIYETGLGEFDQLNVLCDMRVPQEIWRWDRDQVMGFEVWMEGEEVLEDLDATALAIEDRMPYSYEANTITSEYPELFEWVALQHQNVWFILLLMVLIAIINMVSVILILVLERTRTIGLLKALGMHVSRIRELFVSNALFLVLLGLVLGNLLGLALIWSQQTWGWLQVDQESYFVRVVPTMWKWDWFLHINFGVLAVCTLFMYLPSLLVTRISSIKALRFD